jgi:hypothetical protein
MHGERVGPTVAVWAGALIGAAYKLAFPVGLRRPSLVAFAALASFVLFGLRPTLVSMAQPAVGLILAGLALLSACLQAFPMLEVDRQCCGCAGPSQFDPKLTLAGRPRTWLEFTPCNLTDYGLRRSGANLASIAALSDESW